MLDNRHAAYGTAVMTVQSVLDSTVRSFTTQQNQFDGFTVIATAGQFVQIGLRVGATSLGAQKAYGYSPLNGEYQVVTVPFNTSAAQTATDVKTALDALSLITGGDLVTTAPGGGIFTIATNNKYGLQIDYGIITGCTKTVVRIPVDLATDDGEVILIGTVKSDDPSNPAAMRYSENPIQTVSPTSTVGLYVGNGQSFSIEGKKNILTAQFVLDVDAASDGVVDYIILK